jgi:hypothetical protein
MDATAWIACFFVAGVVVCLAMLLVFLWKVYVRGGLIDLERAAKALNEVYDPEWPSKLMKYLPAARKGSDVDDEPKSA